MLSVSGDLTRLKKVLHAALDLSSGGICPTGAPVFSALLAFDIAPSERRPDFLTLR